MKHALLVLIIRGLQRKPKGLLLLDTHAGRGEYDLAAGRTGDSLPRQPEHPNGVGRAWHYEGGGPLRDYLDLVRGYSPEMSRYPGSPWFLARLAREQDRLALCELQPDECEELIINLGRQPRVSIQPLDGYVALKAMLPPPERRALVLIDPPYEAADEWDRLLAALALALGRFPSGTYAIWHPVTERSRSASFWADLASKSLPPTWAGRIIVDPDSAGLRGCGLVVVNPPWGFEVPAAELLANLAAVLGGAVESRWIKPEK